MRSRPPTCLPAWRLWQLRRSGIRDERQLALYLGMLDLLMGVDNLFQREARRNHRMELACGEQVEQRSEILPEPLRALPREGPDVVECGALPIGRQRPQSHPQVLLQ